jgi:hypothetical protein
MVYFVQASQQKKYDFFLSPNRATFLAYLILMDFIILIIFVEQYTNYWAPHYAVLFNLLSVKSF